MKCRRCDGCGVLTNRKPEEPWTGWALPSWEEEIVLSGVLSKTCPDCGGTGAVSDADAENHD